MRCEVLNLYLSLTPRTNLCPPPGEQLRWHLPTPPLYHYLPSTLIVGTVGMYAAYKHDVLRLTVEGTVRQGRRSTLVPT